MQTKTHLYTHLRHARLRVSTHILKRPLLRLGRAPRHKNKPIGKQPFTKATCFVGISLWASK